MQELTAVSRNGRLKLNVVGKHAQHHEQVRLIDSTCCKKVPRANLVSSRRAASLAICNGKDKGDDANAE
jgi:hypothetical protein